MYPSNPFHEKAWVVKGRRGDPPFTIVNRPKFARIGNRDLVAEFFERVAGPPGVGAHLLGYST